jgi:hypothetical protein
MAKGKMPHPYIRMAQSGTFDSQRAVRILKRNMRSPFLGELRLQFRSCGISRGSSIWSGVGEKLSIAWSRASSLVTLF